MPNKFEEENVSPDPVLEKLADAVEPIADMIETSENHAMLVIGVKYIEGEHEGVQTYMGAMGFYGIIAEGLYAELVDQIEKGNTALFSILRDVVRDVEEDLGLDPDQVLDDQDSTTLH